MHLYNCSLDTSMPLATSGQIGDILRARFTRRMEKNPPDSEVKCWRNSLGALAEAIEGACSDDAWMILEYQLPLCSLRVDAMVVGSSKTRNQGAVLLELKQWDRCEPTSTPEIVAVGGTEMLHPSAQARGYRQYLEDAHLAFADGAVRLSSCAYLHKVRTSVHAPRGPRR
jgi:hypothetical protein